MKEIPYYASVEINGELYFSASRFNALFKMNLCTGEIIYIGRVKDETRESGLHRFAFKHENCVFFIPSCGDCIAKLQLETLEISSIQLPQKECSECEGKFAAYVHVGDSVWLIPSNYNALLQFDLKEEEIKKIDSWPGEMKHSNAGMAWFVAACCVSHYIYMCPYEAKYFTVFDIESRKLEFYEWKYPIHAFSDMVLHKDVLWFLPECDYPYIVGYSLETGEKYYIETGEHVDEHVQYLHDEAAIIGDYIVLTPFKTDYWLVLDMQTHKIEKLTVTKRRWAKKYQYPLYNAVHYYSEGIIVTSLFHAYALFINLHSHEVKEVRMEADDRACTMIIKNAISQGGFYQKDYSQEVFLYESAWGLPAYLQALCMCSNKKEIDSVDLTYGMEIFQKII